MLGLSETFRKTYSWLRISVSGKVIRDQGQLVHGVAGLGVEQVHLLVLSVHGLGVGHVH